MATQFLTRNDDGYDSIEWIYEVHLKKQDNKSVKSALITGNEDYPERIALFKSANPNYDAKPYQVWVDDDNGGYKLGNPSRGKKRNPSMGVIKGQMTRKSALVRGTNALMGIGGKIVKIGRNSITMFLPKGGASKLKRSNPGVKVRNIAQGFYDANNRFHPIRASWDYDEARAGEFGFDEDVVVRKKTKRSAGLSPATKRKRAIAKKKAEAERIALAAKRSAAAKKAARTRKRNAKRR